MGIEIHRTVAAIADEWDALADEVVAPPFMRPGWFAAWSEAFAPSGLMVVTLRRGSRLAAVLPLTERHGAGRSATNFHSPRFDILAADEAAVRDLAQAVFARRPRSMILRFVEPDSASMQRWLACAVDAGYTTRVQTIVTSPFIDTTGTWEAYEARIDTKIKADLRRRRRRMADEGQIAIEVSDGSVDLDALLEEGFRVEAAGWKGAAGTAIAANPATRRFYGQIARWAAERGLLRLCFLRIDGVAIAFDFDLEAGGAHYALKGGYDEAFRRFAPAKVLRMDVIERAFARDVARYEFLGDNEPYKREWADQVTSLVTAQAFSPSLPGRIERVAHSHGRPLAKRTLVAARRLRGHVRREPSG